MHNIYYLGLSGERSLPFGLLVSDAKALVVRELIVVNISRTRSWNQIVNLSNHDRKLDHQFSIDFSHYFA